MTTETMTPLQIAARAHRDADMLRAGFYGRMNGRFHGCSVGCFAHEIDPTLFAERRDEGTNLHRLVADAHGYPEWLAHLQDRIFEGLPDTDRIDWHVQFADAIAVRSRDWQVILHDAHAGILRIAERTAGSAAPAVSAVRELHERREPSESAAWSAARSAAWSAARSAARSAAESAAWSAAWSAAESAAGSAAWSAARSAAYREIRDLTLAAITAPTEPSA